MLRVVQFVETIRYLSRYTNRVAISNHCLIAIEGDDVLFRYKDYRDADQWKTMRMPGMEFVQRFLRHLLPRGMAHIRQYGFMGNGRREQALARIREVLGAQSRSDVSEEVDETPPEVLDEEDTAEQQSRRCRRCDGGVLQLILVTPRPTVDELLRMPFPFPEAEQCESITRTREPLKPPRLEQLMLPMTLPPCFDPT